MTRSTLSVALLASLLVAGCKPDPALKKAEVIGRGSLPVTDYRASADGGLIQGVISFTGKAPARPKIDMSMDPACSMSASENDAEQYVVTDGKLANVYLYIKNGAAQSAALPDARPVVLDQSGCRYRPHVIAIQQGGSVEFRNSDPTMHNVHTVPQADGNPGIDVSQGPGGAPQVKPFPQPEIMLPVRCNNHPWMNAFVNVSPTPYFTVSATDGGYKIGGLPPGHYLLAAVHEKLGEQDFAIDVPPKGQITQNIAFGNK